MIGVIFNLICFIYWVFVLVIHCMGYEIGRTIIGCGFLCSIVLFLNRAINEWADWYIQKNHKEDYKDYLKSALQNLEDEKDTSE